MTRAPARALPPQFAQPTSTANVPRPEPAGEVQGLSLLLRVEAEARSARDRTDLKHLIANEARKLTRARQVFVVTIAREKVATVQAISSLGAVDRDGYLVKSVEETLRAFSREQNLRQTGEWQLPAFTDVVSSLPDAYPFPYFAWMPFVDRAHRVFGGMLLTRDIPWSKEDLSVGHRLGQTFAHAWRELATSKRFAPDRQRKGLVASVGAVALLASLAWPVPMTALAPVEIVAEAAHVVASEIDAVVDIVSVEPGTRVRKGDALLKLSDTTLRNRAEVARQDVAVAEARVRQSTMLSFSDARGRHELGIAEAELSLKRAELEFARDGLAKTVVRAPADGIVIFADKKALTGKPVAVGERLMEIANPAEVEARIDLAALDAIALKDKSFVRLFLDVDPLSPWTGDVVRADYRARPSDTDVLVYRVFARLTADERAAPRLGLRGTAQVHGDSTWLGFYLLRRPLAAARQWIGL